MGREKVALYIDDTSLRLLVTQDRLVKEWATLPLESGIVKNNVVVNEAEVAARIRHLFKALKIGTKKIAVGISGLHCLSRPIILPQLPKEMLEEAVKREAKRLLPVPLEQLYLSWQNIAAPEGKIQVFLVAIPRNTIDALFKTLRLAGVRPYLLDLKPLLFTKMAKEATAVIVDVQDNEFDVVVMSEGIPQPVRTIPFAGEELSGPEKINMIVNDIERTISFFNSNNPGKSLAATVPIFVSGELVKPKASKSLSADTGHPVIPLSSPLQHNEGFVPTQYMANIGLTLHKAATGKDYGPSTINMNALPLTYKSNGVSLAKILTIAGAAVVVGSLLSVSMLVRGASTDITSVRGQLAVTEQLLQQKTLKRQELSKDIVQLQKQVTDIQASLDKFAVATSSLQKQTTRLNQDLKMTLSALPQSITLKSIGHNGKLLTVSGRAQDEKAIMTYVNRLNADELFADITVTSITRNKDNSTDFIMVGTHEGQNIAASSLEAAVNNLPRNISVINVTYGKDQVTINATTPEKDAILAYLKRLEDSGLFSDIVVSDMTKMDSGEMKFGLVLKLGK